jgi:hypothetical protein
MRPLFILVTAGLFLVACSSTEWVNVNNPKADYASDYRKCEEEGYSNPKFQGGMKMILQAGLAPPAKTGLTPPEKINTPVTRQLSTGNFLVISCKLRIQDWVRKKSHTWRGL